MLVVRRPAADLVSRIETVWSVTGEARAGTSFHELFPDGGASLVIRLSPAGCRAVLLGPVTELATIERDDRAEYVGVRFRTGQAPALGDATPRELTNAHVELDRIQGLRLDDLAERLSATSDAGARQRVLEDLLREAPPLVRSARARRVAALLEGHGGRLRIDALAGGLGLHVRSLERLCQDELGMSPKRLARIARLREVLLRLRAGGFGTLAELALACGYADQPHLVRDFKALTGRPPGHPDAARPRQVEGTPRTPVVHRYRGRRAR